MAFEKYREIFTGREDIYGFNRMCVKEPLTEELYRSHIAGIKRIGVYPLINIKMTKWLAFDIDEDDFGKILLIVERLEHYGIAGEIEKSKSKGFHIWLLLNKEIEAVKIRLVAEMILQEVGITCEIFPKQDELFPDRPFGNFLFLPLFGDSVKDGRTIFIDREQNPTIISANEVGKLAINKIKKIEEIVTLNDLVREDIRSTPQAFNESRTDFITNLPCIENMQEGGMKSGEGRNEVGFRLAIHFRRKGLNSEDVLALLNLWNSKNTDKLRKPEITTIIESVFKGNYKSYGCDSAIVKKFCDKEKCPFKQNEQRKKLIDEGVMTLTYRDENTIVFKKKQLEYRVDNIQSSSGYSSIKGTITILKDGVNVFKDIINFSKNQQRKKVAKEMNNTEIESDLLQVEELIKKQLLKEIQNEQEKPKQKYLMTEQEKNEATKYLHDNPRILAEVIKVTNRMGVIGEEILRLMVYLCYTSRILSSPLSITIKGESSSGKSFICDTVRRLIPEEGYYFITKATQQAFFHLPEDGLQHRIVFIAELPGSEAADYSIRTAQTEGDLVLLMPQKDPLSGEIETKTKRVKGPVGFMMTTTKASLFDENETRNFSLFTDDGPALTKRSVEITISKGLGQCFNVPEKELNIFKNVQRLLGHDFIVKIPFSKELFDAFPDRPVRVRRDRERFRVLINVIAILHQFHRKQYEENGQRVLEASLADYFMAKKIAQGTLAYTIMELGPASREVWRAVTCINLEKIPEEGDDVPSFTYKELQEILAWKYEKTRKWTKTLTKAGYLDYIPKGGRKSEARMQVSQRYSKRFTKDPKSGEAHPGEELDLAFLPSVEELYEKYPCDKDSFYYPFSGRSVDILSIDAPF
ncbi:MAG: primase C-terminal domain-containing protein [Candidatus Omnitrophota bacterium]